MPATPNLPPLTLAPGEKYELDPNTQVLVHRPIRGAAGSSVRGGAGSALVEV